MEVGVLGNAVLILVEVAASLADDSVEIIDGVEVFVDERLIDEGPQVLGGL